MISINPHKNPVKQVVVIVAPVVVGPVVVVIVLVLIILVAVVLVVVLFCTQGNCALERSSNLPKTTEVVSEELGLNPRVFTATLCCHLIADSRLGQSTDAPDPQGALASLCHSAAVLRGFRVHVPRGSQLKSRGQAASGPLHFPNHIC